MANYVCNKQNTDNKVYIFEEHSSDCLHWHINGKERKSRNRLLEQADDGCGQKRRPEVQDEPFVPAMNFRERTIEDAFLLANPGELVEGFADLLLDSTEDVFGIDDTEDATIPVKNRNRALGIHPKYIENIRVRPVVLDGRNLVEVVSNMG